MLSAYPACFFKEKTGYSVIFPDLNWLATCGDTLNEALEAAVDCLAGYLYTGQQRLSNNYLSNVALSNIGQCRIKCYFTDYLTKHIGTLL